MRKPTKVEFYKKNGERIKFQIMQISNLNDLARIVTLEEGKIRSLPISQVKEVIKIVLKELTQMPYSKVAKLLKRYEE